MTSQWIDRTPERPDRYLDWDLLNRRVRGDTTDGWCSVLIQIDPGPGADAGIHMSRLMAELRDPALAGKRTILANEDEVVWLRDRMTDKEPPNADDPRLTFFVYMPESRIYRDGDYESAGPFRIRFAGPPIPGLRFNLAHEPLAVTDDVRAAPGHVAIGIIDHAIAFANERFRSRRGIAPGALDNTRVRRLWVQEIEKAQAADLPSVLFGKRLTDAKIRTAFAASAKQSGRIDEGAVYTSTGVVDFSAAYRQATAMRVGHGTHVMDLACGYDLEDEAGERRPILAVQLPEPVALDTSGVSLASYVLQGLRQIMLWAGLTKGTSLPLVVNFSFGLFAGPKDGTHLIEKEMMRLVDYRDKNIAPTAVVIPAGNTFRARVTASMSLAPRTQETIDWIIHPDCGTPSFLEIWLDDGASSGSPVILEITPPDGLPGPPAMPTHRRAKVLQDGVRPIGAVYFDASAGSDAAGAERSRIFVAINPTRSFRAADPLSPCGSWKVTLKNTSTHHVDAHLYIQREDTPAGDRPPGRQSYFDHENAYFWDKETGNYDKLGNPSTPCPICHAETLSSIATHPSMIVAGAALAERDHNPPEPSLYTSAGPTRSRSGPDFGAVVDESRALGGTLAAGTHSGSVVALDGTSIAAPQAARLLADAGVDVDELMIALGIGPATPIDSRLGRAIVSRVNRHDIPSRRRP